MLAISNPYCDKVTVTQQETEFHRVGMEYTDLAESMGGHVEINDQNIRSIRLADNEQILVQLQRKLTRITLNGRACAALRLAGNFGEALGIAGSAPHRVTQIHAKVDLFGDNLPSKLHLFTKQIMNKGFDNLRPTSCRSIVEVRPDKQHAHNVYIGKKTSEIQRAIYDKRLERHEKKYKDFDESIDEISIELRVQKGITRAGLSLNDAYDVESLFWQYMSDISLISSLKPKHVKSWVSTGSGFECLRTIRTPEEKILDYEKYGEWKSKFKQAHACGKLEALLKSMNDFAKHL